MKLKISLFTQWNYNKTLSHCYMVCVCVVVVVVLFHCMEFTSRLVFLKYFEKIIELTIIIQLSGLILGSWFHRTVNWRKNNYCTLKLCWSKLKRKTRKWNRLWTLDTNKSKKLCCKSLRWWRGKNRICKVKTHLFGTSGRITKQIPSWARLKVLIHMRLSQWQNHIHDATWHCAMSL